MTLSRNQPRETVKSTKKRKASSTQWLQRQLNDGYVHEARKRGYRARSVFKLEEIDAKHGLLKKGMAVVDLGAAPGSWSQYAAQKGCRVVAVDRLAMDPIGGVTILEGDFLEAATGAALHEALGGPADLVLSDIAPSTTGQRAVDRLRSERVGEAVLVFAGEVLVPGGHCLLKLIKGAEAALLPAALERFQSYRLIKPRATRSESSEMFLLALKRKAPAGTGDDPGNGAV